MKVIGFAGYSGAGKTTLVEALVALMTQRGLKVSVIKHAHHHFDVDREGKDSWRHRKAGAYEVLLASDQRLALMREYPQPALPHQHHQRLDQGRLARARISGKAYDLHLDFNIILIATNALLISE